VILCDPSGYGFLAAATFRGASCFGTCTYEVRADSLFAQLLKERANRLNPSMKVRNMKLFVGRVQIVVR